MLDPAQELLGSSTGFFLCCGGPAVLEVVLFILCNPEDHQFGANSAGTVFEASVSPTYAGKRPGFERLLTDERTKPFTDKLLKLFAHFETYGGAWLRVPLLGQPTTTSKREEGLSKALQAIFPGTHRDGEALATVNCNADVTNFQIWRTINSLSLPGHQTDFVKS